MDHHIVLSKHVVRICIASVIGMSMLGLLVISQDRSVPKLYRHSEFLLDTFVEMTVAARDEQQAQAVMRAAYTEMRRVESLLSRYHESSQIATVNRFAGEGQFIAVDREVLEILQRSLDYSGLTSGLFDITVGPLIDLWGIGTDHEQVPDDLELRRILQYVDYRKVEIRPEQEVRLGHTGMTLDLGGIAKGYSIDRGVEVLRRHHIRSALLNAGGDIRCIGVKPDGTPWQIGVQNPRDTSNISGVIALDDRAVATSGDYERYFMHQGTRYHHIFRPDTGKPARKCQSVTILTDTAERADVLATAVFTMGPEQGQAFLEERAGVEGMIITADGEIVVSSGFFWQQTN